MVYHTHNYSYSPLNSQMIAGSPPPVTHHLPPHLVQGSVPIVRPVIQGQTVVGPSFGQSINSGPTIIQAPVPIIKPVVYQTIESSQHIETIQKLLDEYTGLYNKYQEVLAQKGEPRDH